MANAEIKPGYPFSQYTHHGERLSERDERLADLLVDFFNGRLTARQFASEASVGADAASAFESFRDGVDSSRFGFPIPPAELESFREKLGVFLKGFFGASASRLAERVVGRLHELRVLQPLFDDDELEEIMVNGVARPVFVFHRTAGVCETNFAFKSDKEIRDFLSQIGVSSNRPFDDARLPDGTRVNAVFPPVCEEPVITVRKFRRKPFSILDLIHNHTVTSELAAFLWMCIDGYNLYPANVLIVGGTASGKTTLLNALSTFIPPSDRVVTIEDTRELDLYGKQDWVPLESAPNATLQDLVRNSLRMRPDRIIVGEIRGAEAEAMFSALNVGHRGSLGTLHANSDRDAISKLENQPMMVPRSLIPLVDVIIVLHRLYDRRFGLVRRVLQVSEVSRIEDVVALNELYKRDPLDDSLKRSPLPSQVREKIAHGSGLEIAAVQADLKKREEILNYLLQKGVTEQHHVQEFLRGYYEHRLQADEKARSSVGEK